MDRNNTYYLGAFYGDPEVQAFFVNRATQHTEADELIRGIFWEPGDEGLVGCAVGCLAHQGTIYVHEQLANQTNIPVDILRLVDYIFENLPAEDARYLDWPLAFITSVPLGVDLSGIVEKMELERTLDPSYHTFLIDHGTELLSMASELLMHLYDLTPIDWLDGDE